MAKNIQLTPLKYNKFAVVDDEDFDRASKYRWCYSKSTGQISALVNGRRTPLSNFILDVPLGVTVDHIDRHQDNNMRSNLRVATRAQNNANTLRRKRSNTGYIGVYQRYETRFKAELAANGVTIYLGTYDTAKEAAIARDKAAREFHGEFAVLNFPDEESDNE